MKRVILLASVLFLFISSSVFAYTSPGKPEGFVDDFAHTISVQGKSTLEQQLSDFRKQTDIEVAVVTLQTLGDETIETYAAKLFQEWGIGGKEKNNGALFLIVPNEHQVRIEVGYGLEGALTDAQSNGIIQGVVLPEFKNNNLEQGIMKGTDAILSVVKSEADYSKDASVPKIDFTKIIIFVLFGIPYVIGIMARSRSWWFGGAYGFVLGVGVVAYYHISIIWILVFMIIGWIIDFIVSKHPPKGPGGGFWPIFFGGGRGGSSGGGFGGFGGGMSGGGGSSGRW